MRRGIGHHPERRGGGRGTIVCGENAQMEKKKWRGGGRFPIEAGQKPQGRRMTSEMGGKKNANQRKEILASPKSNAKMN